MLDRDPHDAAARERLRVTAINEIGRLRQRRDLADIAIMQGWPVNQFTTELLGDLAPERKAVTEVGLTQKEIQQYSVLRMINHFAERPDTRPVGLEAEASTAVAKSTGRELTHRLAFYVPAEILTRDLTAAVAGAGGFLKDAAHQGGAFIDVLRNRSVVFRLGATRLPNLRGDCPIPRKTNTGAATWLSTEGSTIAQNEAAFGEVALTPKTVGGFSKISRQLSLQASPAAEQVVLADIAGSVGTAVDLAALNGSGASGQPTGILLTSGIGSVTGTSLASAGIIEFQTDVNTANGLSPAAGYVTTPAVAALLMARPRLTSGTTGPLWEGSQYEGAMIGHQALTTTQMPTATMLYGDFAELIIGEWATLELQADPFTDFKTAKIGLRALWTTDTAVRHAAAFSAASSIT